MPRLNIVLDATMLDTFQLCPAKLNFRFNMNKVTPSKARPLDRGTLVHIGCESYYNSLREKLPFDAAVERMVNDIHVSYAEDSDLEPPEVDRVVEVMVEYVNHWRTADQGFVINTIEQSFSYVLYEDEQIRIIMMGKIDLIVTDNKYENLPFDHKSYDRDFPVKRLTNQFCNYAVATGSNYLIVNRIGFQKTLKPEQKFKRVPLTYDPLILEQWKSNTIEVVKSYVNCASDNVWPMNLTSCDKFNRLCEYYEICDSSGEEAKAFKLEANFKTTDKWDVSKSLGKS